MLVGLEVLADVHASVAEQVERLTLGLAVADGVKNGFGGVPFMDEQRHCGHVQLMPLSLARPVEERFGNALEVVSGIGYRGQAHAAPLPHLGLGKHRRLAVSAGAHDQANQPLAQLPFGLLVPRQRGVE